MSRTSSRIAAVLFALGLMATDAWAVVGRPLTPVSYAGVARRTSRRTTRRTMAYTGAYGGYGAYGGVYVGATVAALPAGCPLVGGVYSCGGYAYRPVYDGPDVVYVVEGD